MSHEGKLPIGRWPEPFEDRSLRKGLDGEEKVARRLALLGQSWMSLHSIPLDESGTVVDHLLVGPGGVFTLKTLNHTGHDVWVANDAYMVNGIKQDHVANAAAERARVATTLSRATGVDVKVDAVIVTLAEHFCRRQHPGEVHVLELEELRFWLKGRPVTFAPTQIANVYQAARQSTNWATSVEMVGAEGH
jgi:hypothetical protein